MPAVSVIIPTYQGAQFIADTIQSVLAQSFSDYEIIVVDDGSSDTTPEVLQQFGHRITVIHQANSGVAAARNTGIRSARGRYIALLDHDDLWLPDKLAKQLPVLEAAPDLGLLYADAFFLDDLGTHTGELLSHKWPPSGHAAGFLFVYNFIPTLTVVLRRECVDDVGGFEETVSGTDDYDLWIRVSESRWRMQGLTEPLGYYRLHATNQHRDGERMALNMLRTKERAFARNPAIRQLAPLLLDRHFYDSYLHLAQFYLDRSHPTKARIILQRYRQQRGVTPEYERLCVASGESPARQNDD